MSHREPCAAVLSALRIVLIAAIVYPSPELRAQVAPVGGAGIMFGFPLTGASALPALMLNLGLAIGRDGGRTGRLVVEGVLHPRLIPALPGSASGITSMVGLGYDLRLPVKARVGEPRVSLGFRSYLAGDEGGAVLLTMPRLSYEVRMRREKFSGGFEFGLQYFAFTNARRNREFTRVLVPISLIFRF